VSAAGGGRRLAGWAAVPAAFSAFVCFWLGFGYGAHALVTKLSKGRPGAADRWRQAFAGAAELDFPDVSAEGHAR
jgi:hypothetical protein